MKKCFTYLIASIIIVATLAGGCKKGSNNSTTTTTPQVIPDVSDFSVMPASPYIVGSNGTILVTSTSLASGTYTVQADWYTGNTNAAQLVMNNHSGTFQIPIDSPGWATFVTIQSITNSAGNTTRLISNNYVTLTDTMGLMTATIIAGSSTTSFRTVATGSYIADTAGHLFITGSYWYPTSGDSKVIKLGTKIYTNSTGTYSFTGHSTNGSAAYISYIGYSSPVTKDGLYGQITITSISPVLTGSFSFTCDDSTKFVGAFSCPSPK